MLRPRNQGNLYFHAKIGETNKRDNGSEKALLTASHYGLGNLSLTKFKVEEI